MAGLEQELAAQRVELSRREEELMELRDLLQERLTFFLTAAQQSDSAVLWVRTTDLRTRILLFHQRLTYIRPKIFISGKK